MYINILPLLRCPHCGAKLELAESKKEDEEIVEGKVLCEKGHPFSIRQGILDFQSQEQENFNSWSEYIDEKGNDALGQTLDSKKSENQKKPEKDFINAIVAEAVNLKSGFLLDVASGLGRLLGELLKNIDANVNIISADLSFDVLKWDRTKFRQIHPHIKVNYIACDATNLPFMSLIHI